MDLPSINLPFMMAYCFITTGHRPPACPTSCACGHDFTIIHCISCPKGGFSSIRHNEVRDLTAKMMSEVCNNVSIEPHLKPLSGEALRFKTANSDSNARLDIAANGFWGGRFECCSFFDVRVFNPGAPSNYPFKSTYRRHEREKRHQYEQRVREIEHGHFSPLVFTEWVMLPARYTGGWLIY